LANSTDENGERFVAVRLRGIRDPESRRSDGSPVSSRPRSAAAVLAVVDHHRPLPEDPSSLGRRRRGQRLSRGGRGFRRWAARAVPPAPFRPARPLARRGTPTARWARWPSRPSTRSCHRSLASLSTTCSGIPRHQPARPHAPGRSSSASGARRPRWRFLLKRSSPRPLSHRVGLTFDPPRFPAASRACSRVQYSRPRAIFLS